MKEISSIDKPKIKIKSIDTVEHILGIKGSCLCLNFNQGNIEFSGWFKKSDLLKLIGE